jgi:uncharacterized protein (DUF1778 family)
MSSPKQATEEAVIGEAGSAASSANKARAKDAVKVTLEVPAEVYHLIKLCQEAQGRRVEDFLLDAAMEEAEVRKRDLFSLISRKQKRDVSKNL